MSLSISVVVNFDVELVVSLMMFMAFVLKEIPMTDVLLSVAALLGVGGGSG